MPTQKPTKGRETATQPAKEGIKDRPVKVVRIRDLRANIWANRLDGGAVVYNVTVDRLWREDDEINDQGEVTKRGEWKQSASFGKDDLLLLGKIADFAHTWIYRRIQDDRHEESF
jgi:hypothetical protein